MLSAICRFTTFSGEGGWSLRTCEIDGILKALATIQVERMSSGFEENGRRKPRNSLPAQKLEQGGDTALQQSGGQAKIVPGTRNESLDIAKGLAVVFVVYWHVLLASRSIPFYPLPIYIEINEIVLAVLMPLFFFVSGIVIAHTLEESWPVFFRKRLLQLSWIYFLWTIIYVIIQRQPPHYIITSIYNSRIHLWFIWGLLIFRVGARVLSPYKNKVVVAFALITFFAYFDYPEPFWDVFTPHQLKFFMCSFFFFYATFYGSPLLIFIRERAILIVACSSIIAAVAVKFNIELLLAIAGTIIGLGISTLIFRYVPILRRLFTFTGRSSLEIYVIHFAFPGIAIKLMMGLPAANIWLVPAATILLVVTSVLIRRASDPYAPWLFKPPHWLERIFSERAATSPEVRAEM